MSTPETVIVAKAFLQRPNGDVLVLRRSEMDSHRPGEEDLPGGAVEDEDVDAGVVREIYEETNLRVGKAALRLIHTTEPFAGRDAVIVRKIFNGLVDETAAEHVETNPAEHESAAWVPRAELRDHLTPPYQEAYDHADRDNLWAVQDAA